MPQEIEPIDAHDVVALQYAVEGLQSAATQMKHPENNELRDKAISHILSSKAALTQLSSVAVSELHESHIPQTGYAQEMRDAFSLLQRTVRMKIIEQMGIVVRNFSNQLREVVSANDRTVQDLCEKTSALYQVVFQVIEIKAEEEAVGEDWKNEDAPPEKFIPEEILEEVEIALEDACTQAVSEYSRAQAHEALVALREAWVNLGKIGVLASQNKELNLVLLTLSSVVARIDITLEILKSVQLKNGCAPVSENK